MNCFLLDSRRQELQLILFWSFSRLLVDPGKLMVFFSSVSMVFGVLVFWRRHTAPATSHDLHWTYLHLGPVELEEGGLQELQDGVHDAEKTI